MSALETKNVILGTHQVEFLSEVDKILVMEDGKFTQSGSYKELLMTGTPFEKLVNAYRSSLTTVSPSNEIKTYQNNETNLPASSNGSYISITKGNAEGEISVKGVLGIQLTEEEGMASGDVGLKPFLDYIVVSDGLFVLCLAIITQCCFVGLQVVSTYWLAIAIRIPSISAGVWIGVFTGISTLSAFFWN